MRNDEKVAIIGLLILLTLFLFRKKAIARTFTLPENLRPKVASKLYFNGKELPEPTGSRVRFSTLTPFSND